MRMHVQTEYWWFMCVCTFTFITPMSIYTSSRKWKQKIIQKCRFKIPILQMLKWMSSHTHTLFFSSHLNHLCHWCIRSWWLLLRDLINHLLIFKKKKYIKYKHGVSISWAFVILLRCIQFHWFNWIQWRLDFPKKKKRKDIYGIQLFNCHRAEIQYLSEELIICNIPKNACWVLHRGWYSCLLRINYNYYDKCRKGDQFCKWDRKYFQKKTKSTKHDKIETNVHRHADELRRTNSHALSNNLHNITSTFKKVKPNIVRK